MPIRPITSKSNPIIKTIRLVAAQARNAPPELVLAEGTRSIKEALASGNTIEALLISERFGGIDRERLLLDTIARTQNVRVFRVADPVFKHSSAVLVPQGVLALVRLPILMMREVRLPEKSLVLCACGLQDPGNFGTLIRAAAAAGASLVCALTGTVSARNPKTVRASAGAVFRIPLVEHLAARDLLDFCRERSISPFIGSARGGTLHTQTDLTGAAALLLGNEGSGLAEEEWAGIPSVHIPMSGKVESLNVAAAGAILLFEAFRQRSMAASRG
jgi:TrmH family RNA methyltransferase